MRILFFAEQLSVGGAELLFLRKARYFHDHGHEVFFASAGGPLEPPLREAGIPHLAIPGVAQSRPSVPYDEALGDARRLSRYLRRNRIEVVDALPIRPYLMAHHVAGAQGIPVFLECLSPTHFVPVRHAGLVRETAAAGRLIALDPDDAAGSCPRLGVDLDQVRIIPNPVDTVRFRPGPSPLRLEIGAAAGDFVIMSASRLGPDKARYVRMLIDDFASMAEADSGAWLVVAGDGPERAALEAAVARRGIPRVRFLGMRSDLERLYPGADAFVGMGTTVLEAAACGTAVVVANALSLRQAAVAPEEAAMCYFGHRGATTVGYRVPLAEPGTFRAYLDRLRGDRDLREAVAAAGRRAAAEIFGMDRVMGQWEEALEGAIAGSRDKGAIAESRDKGAIAGSRGKGAIAGRVLFVTRPDAMTNPGGDTIQLLRTREELERLGLRVDISFSAAPDARTYDLAHLFNLQLPELASAQMQAIRAAGVPVVVSPIFWDHAELDSVSPRIRRAFAAAPEERQRLLAALAAAREGTDGTVPYPVSPRVLAQRDLQREVAAAADLLLPNSAAEAAVLTASLGPGIARSHVVPNGIVPGLFRTADPDVFAATFGRRDFVLAAARWDDRKNLLMLCEALRGTGLPLVLVGGRPNAEYESLVRSALPPDALVVDPLSQDELASAYAAARVHALPSWFETPGLSSMEAAMAGCAIVVGDRAAEREYFEDAAYYCDPASVASIRAAIAAAWERFEADRPRREALRERLLERCTWERAAIRTLEAYEQVLGIPLSRGVSAATAPIGGAPEPSVEVVHVPDEPGCGETVACAFARSGADVLVLLAPGVRLDGESQRRLVAPLAADPGVAATGPVSDRGAPLQHVDLYLPPEAITGRQEPEIVEALVRSGRGPVGTELLDSFCLAIRRSALEEAGGWDAELVPEHAELDLSWRLREAGYRLAVASDVFVRSPGTRAGGRPDASRLAASADRLAAKLEAHHGRGRVPRPEALWGVTTFRPALDLWGPRPTRFRLSQGPETAQHRQRVEAAFGQAFGPEDPVALEIAEPESDGAESNGAQSGGAQSGGAQSGGEVRSPEGGETRGEGDPGTPASPGSGAPGGDPAERAAEAIAGSPSEQRERIVVLRAGAPIPGHDPGRITPELLRQVAGYRPQPRAPGLTSAIVLAVDQPDYTKLCLETLAETTREPFELIVVDGGVGERTRQVVANFAKKHPDLLWLRTDAPEPAARLLNLGLAAARGEFAALLRGDVVVTEGWLTYLLGHLAAHPRGGLVGPRANGGPGEQPQCGLPYDAVPGMHRFARALARKQAGAVRPTSLLGTFALVMRRDAFEAVGGFDPGFPSGTFEAPDYCLRTLLAGREILLAEDAYVHHFGRQVPAPEVGGDAVRQGSEFFQEKWGPLPAATGGPAVETLCGRWRDRPDRPPGIPLPSRRGLPLVINPARVEGARDRNLLLIPDWEGDPRPWENAIRRYAETFGSDSPVALFLPEGPGAVLQRVSRILDEVRPRGDTPDVLILDGLGNVAGVVAASQGVVRIGTASEAVACRIAEILGKPILSNPGREEFEAWWASAEANSTAPSHKDSC